MILHPNRLHVIVADGTLARLDDGQETNAGLLFKLLRRMTPSLEMTLHYQRGIRGTGLKKWVDVAAGIGINKAICNSYATLARRYRPGDRIMLFGFSRGAYTVRSMAGMIERIGLLHHDHVTHERVLRAFYHYETHTLSKAAQAFRRSYCHTDIEIEVIGVWDTVKALGIPFPLLSRLAPMATEFHNHQLADKIHNAFQALALDENRTAYRPIFWTQPVGWNGRCEQVWFPGAHGDVGGQVGAAQYARPLSNIPLIWMLERAESCGLPLPADWREGLVTDAGARMMGSRKGIAKYFVYREPRRIPPDTQMHSSVAERMRLRPRYKPRAIPAEVPLQTDFTEDTVSSL